ncbi:MAG: isocitrate lyase/phosphoenolpyruvate mutase family protein [Burkholderiales bacterium]|nr:isocitrate lyase/phosphoenolpyruvate mutase family protein [Burkholderiales bacterium]
MSDQNERAERFAALHASAGAFIIPNPWDAGSARLLAGLGFESLASTSWGAAVALGQLDGAVARDAMIEHVRQLSAATDLPLSADLENCYAHDPREAARTLLLAAGAGAVGGSIEDYSNDAAKPIYDFPHAVERVQAAVEAVRRLEFRFTLTARAENLLRGRNDLDDTIRRLQAFEAAGADVLYAPGLTTLEQVRTVCGALGKPVNVLAPQVKGATLATLAEAGAKRLSVGGALARAAVGALLRAGREMREQGSFGWTADLASLAEVKRLLGTPGA